MYRVKLPVEFLKLKKYNGVQKYIKMVILSYDIHLIIFSCVSLDFKKRINSFHNDVFNLNFITKILGSR